MGLVAERELPDGRVIHINEMLFGNHKLCIGPKNELFYEDEW